MGRMQLIKFSEPVLMAWGFPRAPSAPDPGLQECPIQPVQKRDLQRRQMGSGASLLVTQGAQDSLTHCGKPWGGQKWAIYSLDVLLFLFGTSLLFHVQF